MGLIKQIIELVYYYRKDQGEGIPYWKDTTLIALVVSILATQAASHFGMNIDSKLQTEIVAVVTGIGALFSPHTGIKAKPTEAIDKLKLNTDHGAS